MHGLEWFVDQLLHIGNPSRFYQVYIIATLQSVHPRAVKCFGTPGEIEITPLKIRPMLYFVLFMFPSDIELKSLSFLGFRGLGV